MAGWLAGGRGAPAGPGAVGPTRPMRVRRSADDVAGAVAAAPETAAALRPYGLGWEEGEGVGACVNGFMTRSVTAYLLMIWNDVWELVGYGSYGKR